MRRLSFGSASCYAFLGAGLGIARMGYCRGMIASTPPGGSGEFKGMGHLGWRLGIFLMIGVIPTLNLVGFGLGLIGLYRAKGDRSLPVRGVTLNVLGLVLSPSVAFWAMSFLGETPVR